MKFGRSEYVIDSKTLICYVVRWLINKWIEDITEIKVQKLSYMVYGFYLAATEKCLVVDEKPVAYQSWPIFRTANTLLRKIWWIVYFYKDEFNIENIWNKLLKQIIIDVIDTYWSRNSKRLVARSCLKDSPRTITKNKENGMYSVIDDELTYNYFVDKSEKNKIRINKRLNSPDVYEIENSFINAPLFSLWKEGAHVVFLKEWEKISWNNKKRYTAKELMMKTDYKKEVGETEIQEEQIKDLSRENSEKDVKIQSLKDTNRFRWIFVWRVVVIATWFLIITLDIIQYNIFTSDSVKITLLSSTTATIIWLPIVIVRWLFWHKDKKKKFKKKKEE